MENLTFPPSPAIRPVHRQTAHHTRAIGNTALESRQVLTDSSSQVVAVQGLDVLDLEGVEVEII